LFEAALILLSAVGSFVGQWYALQVRLKYMLRDIDKAHERIDNLQEQLLRLSR